MGVTHTSMIRRTKQNAVNLGVSLVVFGPRLGPPWPWMGDMLILDLDELGQTKIHSAQGYVNGSDPYYLK